MAVDAFGNAVATGRSTSTNLLSGAFDTTANGGWDVLATKLNPVGEHLWSTYLGGTSDDCGYGIAVDSSGSVLISGTTTSRSWVSGGYTTNCGCAFQCSDAFVAQIRTVPSKGAITIARIVNEAGTGKLTFEAAGYSAPSFVMESTAFLASPIQWVVETNATITSTGEPGKFAVQLPLQGGARFYRIRVLP
ncbi:MAG: SBBP repeat-containing protein [Verrucomicrobiota bacterium]